MTLRTVELANKRQLRQAEEAMRRKEYALALQLFEPLAKSGLPEAQIWMGLIHTRGAWEGMDYEKGRYWLEKALSESGSIEGCCHLGCIYLMGIGVPVDYDKAFYYFNRLKDKDHPLALLNLGLLYVGGRGVKEDLALARQYLKRSVQLKNNAAGLYWGMLELSTGHRILALYLFVRYGITRAYLKLFRPHDPRLRTC